MGTLLGDPQVWDDTPARPRPLRRGLVLLAVGVLAGALVGYAVAPRPAPPVPVVPRLTTPAAARPATALPPGSLAEWDVGAVVVAEVGRVNVVEPTGEGRRTLTAVRDLTAVVPASARRAPLVGLAGGSVVAVAADDRVRSLTPPGFEAAGLAGDQRQVLACGAGTSLLVARRGGPGSTLPLACPVAWAAGTPLLAGAGAPLVPVQEGRRGRSVLAGPPGGPLHTVISSDQVVRAAGPAASVGAVALSPDGQLVAAAVGPPGREGVVLVARLAGGEPHRVGLARGYQAAWLGWSPRARPPQLAVAALDRRGELATVALAERAGGGYVLVYQPAGPASTIVLAGAALAGADGFAWAPDGGFLAVSAPAGWTVARVAVPLDHARPPLRGTLLAWVEDAR